ncbi:MAG: radical SAM protein [Chitinispirillales bacterium]|jgi:MoaA/NifB/PqqE/SkfB family radical SAM enzyme|nr:radical SAM protein [Chitinispirillales bacterium]
MRTLKPKAYFRTVGGIFKNFFAAESIFPFYASLKLTAKCNFGCPFCNIHTHSQEDLSTDEIIKILDNLSNSPVLMTSFEGGEPLLRRDVGELLEYARKKCDFYLLFTSSAKNILDYPMEKYCENIDFLHISIDEGHNNLEMFESLYELAKFKSELSVQIVVTEDTIEKLEEKVVKCRSAKANCVVIPAAEMDGAKKKSFPNIDKFEREIRRLKNKYPAVIHTPLGYFSAYKNAKCSSASVIIAPNGKLFYPCNILGDFGCDLTETDFKKWLVSSAAKFAREKMKNCKINCGWYQYYSIDSYLSLSTIGEALSPIFTKSLK